jgi:spore coat protein A, manganese oxidase
MIKRKARKPLTEILPGKRKKAFGIILIVMILTAGGALAQWTGLVSVGAKRLPESASPTPPPGLDPASPVMEYVFANGRMIASEAPQGSGGSCVRAKAFNFDTDNKADIAIWRPGTGVWWIINSSNGSNTSTGWGTNGDQVVPGDYDCDGKTDIAIWRPSTGVWWIINSSNGATTTTGWGVNTDFAVPGYYDGDNKTDIAIWRPSTGQWWILNSSNGSTTTPVWGVSGDKPVPADYDGDGITDLATWRNGSWLIKKSSTGTDYSVGLGVAANNDQLVPGGDFNGDGLADCAVWRPSNGTWYVTYSPNTSATPVAWGQSGDIPAAADFDGDGITDFAVFRPSTAVWYIKQSSNGATVTPGWGQNGDVPVPSAYVRPLP